MNYVKESIERVVALLSCDGRYRVNLHNQVPGSNGYEAELSASEKEIEAYEETVCCKAYYRLTRERKVLREVIWRDAGYTSSERDAPGWNDMRRLLWLVNMMFDDERDDSALYVFRPETEDDITDLCYLADKADDNRFFSAETLDGEGNPFRGGRDLKPGGKYLLRVRYGQIGGKPCGDEHLWCMDLDAYLERAGEVVKDLVRYLDGEFDKDRKEAESGADKRGEMTWKERYKDDDNFIAVIRWSEEDVRAEMESRLMRSVSDDELDDVLSGFDAETLKDRSIELGWKVLGQLTADAMQRAGIKED